MYRTRSATEGWPQSGCRTYMFCRVRVARQCPNNSQSLLCTIGRRWAFCGGWATWSGLHIIVEWATYNRRSYMARGMNPPPNLPCHPLDRVSKSSAARLLVTVKKSVRKVPTTTAVVVKQHSGQRY